MEFELIEWLDARGVSTGWEYKEDVTMDLSEVTSVGVVIEETDRKVVLAPNIDSTDEPQVCGVMSIPKANIIKRVKLQERE